MTRFAIVYASGPNGYFRVEPLENSLGEPNIEAGDLEDSCRYVADNCVPEGWTNPVVPYNGRYWVIILAPDVKKAIDTFWTCYEQIGEENTNGTR